MCGIAGIIDAKKSGFLGFIYPMSDSIRHRGPDDEGYAFLGEQDSVVVRFRGDDTPKDAFGGSEYPYLPNEKANKRIPKGATLALGHRRLSILDLSIRSH